MRIAAACIACATLAVSPAAAGGARDLVMRLPTPTFTADGQMLALAAAGPRVAVSSACDIRVANLLRSSRPVRIPEFGECAAGDLAGVDGLYLGRSTVVARQIDVPSPHGEDYQLFSGPLPRGPLRALGDDWGWTDSGEPSGYGCAWSIAAGGGIVALAPAPNFLGVDGETQCAGVAPTKIRLLGAPRSTLTVPGSWEILATDGRRLALARLGADGIATGEVVLVGLDGTRLAPPRFPATAVARASQGWLVGGTLVLETPKGISARGWTIRGAEEGTVGEGRLLYLKGHVVRVRRLRDGTDRALVRLPTANALLAAGSFGLAISTGVAGRTALYRLSWRTVDRTLTR